MKSVLFCIISISSTFSQGQTTLPRYMCYISLWLDAGSDTQRKSWEQARLAGRRADTRYNIRRLSLEAPKALLNNHIANTEIVTVVLIFFNVCCIFEDEPWLQKSNSMLCEAFPQAFGRKEYIWSAFPSCGLCALQILAQRALTISNLLNSAFSSPKAQSVQG